MRALLKISGEAFKWKNKFGIDNKATLELAKEIKKISDLKIELSIVVWWGNIYRGKDLIKWWLHPSDSHNLSMLSTIFNGVVLKNALETIWKKAVVMTNLDIEFIEKFNKEKAIVYIEKWIIVIFVSWTWNPYFTTDTGAVLMALQTKSELVIKATKVNWIYNKDPKKYKEAKFIRKISYDDYINQNLKIMDLTSIVMAKENKLQIKITSFIEKWELYNFFSWKGKWSIIN